MLTRLQLRNFTVFDGADLRFESLNVVVGENGAGKSHLLKVLYSGLVVNSFSWEGDPSLPQWRAALGAQLRGVFRPVRLDHLVRREQAQAEVDYGFDVPDADFGFSLKVKNEEVSAGSLPAGARIGLPVFLPTQELLTLAPSFISLYEGRHLPFDQTWRDSCVHLTAPMLRQETVPGFPPAFPPAFRPAFAQGLQGESGSSRSARGRLMKALERALGGRVQTDAGGRFQIVRPTGAMEIQLIAEGLRKIAMLAQLIGNGQLASGTSLLWDEPESNLNPRLLKLVARTILELSRWGVQVFVATHSLFLLRELYILSLKEFRGTKMRCFGLSLKRLGGVTIKQGNTIDDIGAVAALDEELEQSDRYLDTQHEAVAK